MPTLVLSPQYDQDSQALWRGAIELGWQVHRLSSWRLTAEDLEIKEPVLYIDGLFGPTIGEAFGKQLVEPPDDWLVRLDRKYRQRSITLMPVGKAKTLSTSIFVKPPNNKSHKAECVKNGSCLTQYTEDDYLVLVSDPVTWVDEYRCFAVDGKVVTASIYLRNGILQRKNDFKALDEELSEAIRFAQRVLDDTVTPNPIVIDVGTINRGSHEVWAVVEINAVWGSGIYGCDPKEVLKALERC